MKKLALAAVAVSVASAASAGETSLGFALTSNYIATGATQTANQPAFQPYIEYEHESGFYTGIWASNVALAPDTAEIDVYAGYRGQAGSVSYDIGYTRYLYNSSGNCCGELILSLDYGFGERLGFTTTIAHDLVGTYRGKQAFSVSLPSDFSVSGAFEANNAGLNTWNLGLGKSLSETVSLDGRYYGSNAGLNAFVVSISVDTTLAALMRK